MKQQSLILLGLPLTCQIAFTAILIQNQEQLDKAARRETEAKSVITAVQDVRLAAARFSIPLIAQRFSSSRESSQNSRALNALVEDRLQILQSVTAGDKHSASAVAEYRHCASHLEELFSAASSFEGGSVTTRYIARYATEQEFLEELAVTFRRMLASEEQLLSRYGPIVREFSPKAIAERARLRQLTILAVIIDTTLVVILAFVFGRGTLARLDTLMKNIQRFRKGEPNLESVGGADEIAALNVEFKSMAETRLEMEETQRALYTMVNHDLRSPLTSIALIISMILQTEGALSASLESKLKKMHSIVIRLVKLAQLFLVLEESRSGKLELNKQSCRLQPILDGGVDGAKGSADTKGVLIELELKENAEVVCDQDRIIQVLTNLMSNAVKHSPKGATIKVSASIVENGRCRFEVRDHGRGITDEQRQKLFQRFSRLEPTVDASSMGLGLYICKLLIDAHAGEIGVESPTGGGSLFWFELP